MKNIEEPVEADGIAQLRRHRFTQNSYIGWKWSWKVGIHYGKCLAELKGLSIKGFINRALKSSKYVNQRLPGQEVSLGVSVQQIY
jgi:hypothetical protein